MVWPVYDAKARFSELLDAALKDGPQVVTRRGIEAAVLVPIDEWKRLQAQAKRTIKDVLLDPDGPHDIPLPSHRPVLKLRPVNFDDQEQA